MHLTEGKPLTPQMDTCLREILHRLVSEVYGLVCGASQLVTLLEPSKCDIYAINLLPTQLISMQMAPHNLRYEEAGENKLG